MQIRRLSHAEIDIAVTFLQAMLAEMASLGGQGLQDTDACKDWLRDSIQTQIDSPDRLFLIASLNDLPKNNSFSEAIGFIEANVIQLPPLFQPKSSLHIGAIYVSPAHRRSGIARSLIEAACQWGREQDCVEVSLHVLQGNLPARSLYERLEFAPAQIEMRRKL